MDDAASFVYLDQLYDNLALSVRTAGKLKGPSVLTSLLEVTNNSRFALLKEASKHIGATDLEGVRSLAEAGFVDESDEPHYYRITGRGIWRVEVDRGILDAERLVEWIDEKHFQAATTARPLSEKEKVIVLGLIATRSFGEVQPIDLHKVTAREQWRIVFEKSYDLLHKLEVVGQRLKREELFGKKQGNEHPVSNLVRHTDALPRKTKGLYKALTKQRYCLDVTDGTNIDAENLSYLWRLILGESPPLTLLDPLTSFCNSVAYDDGVLLFDPSSNPFTRRAADDQVRAALLIAMGAQ